MEGGMHCRCANVYGGHTLEQSCGIGQTRHMSSFRGHACIALVLESLNAYLHQCWGGGDGDVCALSVLRRGA